MDYRGCPNPTSCRLQPLAEDSSSPRFHVENTARFGCKTIDRSVRYPYNDASTKVKRGERLGPCRVERAWGYGVITRFKAGGRISAFVEAQCDWKPARGLGDLYCSRSPDPLRSSRRASIGVAHRTRGQQLVRRGRDYRGCLGDHRNEFATSAEACASRPKDRFFQCQRRFAREFKSHGRPTFRQVASSGRRLRKRSVGRAQIVRARAGCIVH